MPSTTKKKTSKKLTNPQLVAIIVASITGLCTIIAACIGLVVPILQQALDATPEVHTQTTTQIPEPGPTLTESSLESVMLDTLDNRGFCSSEIFAVPENTIIPNFVDQQDVRKRWEKTYDFFQEKGFLIAPKLVDSTDYGDAEGHWIYSCIDRQLAVSQVVWNNSTSQILIKEISIIVEAYDYEPSAIPEKFQIFALLPPELGGGEGSGPIMYPPFDAEIRPTTNAVPLIELSQSSSIIIQSKDAIQIYVKLLFTDSGTYRIHISYDVGDSSGLSATINSSSIVTKLVILDDLDLSSVKVVDIK